MVEPSKGEVAAMVGYGGQFELAARVVLARLSTLAWIWRHANVAPRIDPIGTFSNALDRQDATFRIAPWVYQWGCDRPDQPTGRAPHGDTRSDRGARPPAQRDH